MIPLFARAASAVTVGAALVLVAAPASAHFDLMSPASWSVDDPTNGMPEKLGPCGNEGTPVLALDDAGQPVISAVQEGDMITVSIKEVVFHPGHYRISLSMDWADAGDTVQSGFPPDPTVSMGKTNSGTMLCPGGVTAVCGSVPIEQGPFPVAVPGVGWVLADDVFEHCQPFTTVQTTKVALPPGVTCKECVLQVLEFMSDHGLNNPGGCFYHHCANLSIGGGSVPVEAGTTSGATSGATSGSSTSGSTSGSASTGGTSSGEPSSGSSTTGSAGTASGTMVSSGSMASSGAGPTSGTAATGSASPSGSGTSASSSGSAAPTESTKSGGCAASPGRASSWAALAALALAAALGHRRRSRR